MTDHILTLVKLQTEGRLQRGDELHSTVHGALIFEYARDVTSFVCKMRDSEQRIQINGFNPGPGAYVEETTRAVYKSEA